MGTHRGERDHEEVKNGEVDDTRGRHYQRPLDAVVVPHGLLREIVGRALMLDNVPENGTGHVAVEEDLQRGIESL